MVEYEAMVGSDIETVIGEAINFAIMEDDICQFDFNGLEIKVAKDSNPELIYRDWKRSMYYDDIKSIGPYPKDLTEEEVRQDQFLIENAERERQERENAAKVIVNTKKAELEEKVRDVEVQWSNLKVWNEYVEKNTNPYGKAIIEYAEMWAKLMQKRMGDPDWVVSVNNFATMVDETSFEADIEGITGFMYSCAVGYLVECWFAGELLRQWHNKKNQIGTEGDEANDSGGLLNTALLNIGW